MSRFEVRKSSLANMLLVDLIMDARDITLEDYELLKNFKEYQETKVDICVKHSGSEIERVFAMVQSSCDAQDETSSD